MFFCLIIIIKHAVFLVCNIPAMKVLFLLVVLIFKNVLSYNISDLYKLPKIFKMENYTNCMEEDNLYCEFEFNVKSVTNATNLWKIIQYTDSNEFFFDRKILYRAMCLPKLYKNNEAKLKEIGLAKMKNELKLYDLDADLTYFHSKITFNYELYDYILLGCLVLYFSWIILATSIVYFSKRNTNKYVENFSVIYNYKKLTKDIKNKHYVKLKFMQGIRFYVMLFVLATHFASSFSLAYTENPEYMEEYYSYTFVRYVIHTSSFAVQIFFVLSGWLSILKIDEDSINFSKLSIKNVVILTYNRIARFLPTVLFYLYIWASNIFFSYDIPLTKNVHAYFKNCSNAWFYILVQNWLQFSDFCNFHLWTISLDLQGFIVLLATFYIIIKQKIPILKCLITLTLFFIFIQINVIYFNNLKMHFKVLPRNLTPITRKDRFITLHYTSTIANVPSYLIGSIFGILYLRKTKIILQRFWLLIAIGLMILPLILVDIPMSGLTKSLFGSVLKPILSIGVGIFLLGLVQNASDEKMSVFRRIFENRIVEILGTCTLSMHVFHMCIMLRRSYQSHFPVTLVFHELALEHLGDQIKSILAGFVIYLTIEQPFAMLTRWDYKKERKTDEKENKD